MLRFLLLLLFFPLCAQISPPAITNQTCCPWAYRPLNPCSIGCFDLGMQWLIFTPDTCGWQWGTSIPNTTQSDALTLNPSYASGARLLFGWHQHCSELLFRWWSIDSTSTTHALRPFGTTTPADFSLFGLPDSPGGGIWEEALSRLRFSYSVLELRFAQYLKKRGKCLLQTFANIRWARFEEKLEINAKASLPSAPGAFHLAVFEERCSFNGVGLGVGLSGQYCFVQCLFLSLDLNVMAIPGTLKMPRLRTIYDPDFGFQGPMVEYNVTSRVVPAFDARLVLNHSWCWKRAKFCSELGWEINAYFNALTRTQSNLTVRNTQDLSFSGPFVGLRALF
ncbi:MAG: hypothetical protein JSR80_03750 [Verrucomicrobia bacterium]|nr:hypothetical protein [Verrucomicrobiota bacterium]